MAPRQKMEGARADWSRMPVRPIKHCQAKLRFFYSGRVGPPDHFVACVHRFGFQSRKDMAEALGVGEAQLKHEAGISDAVLMLLGPALGFDVCSDVFVNGEPAAFGQWYNENNKYDGRFKSRPSSYHADDPYERDGSVGAAGSERRIGVPLTARRYGNNPWQINDQLATVELLSGSAPPGEVRVTARIIARATVVAWDEIFVKHLKIIVEPSDSGSSLADIWEGKAGSATIETADGSKVMLVRGGTSRRRSYSLQAVDPDSNVELGELWLPHEVGKELWSVSRVAPGDKLSITLSAFAKDLTSKSDIGKSFARTDGQPLGRNARKILEHLEKPVGRDGYCELCGDVLEFVEKAGE